MKTNNLILTSMKKSMKYICMFLMVLGIHINAWGTGATTLDPTNLKITTTEQTDKCFVGDVLVDYVTVGTYNSNLTIKPSATIQNLTPVAGKITSIVVSAPTYSGATSGNFVIYGGASAGAKTTAIYSGTSTSEITADFSSYNYQYFYIENNTGRQVTTSSIVVNYSGTESGNLIVYPNTFEIEGELEDGEFSASSQGNFYINNDLLAEGFSWYAESITSGDDEHCTVDAYGSEDYDGSSSTNNFDLNVWADAAGTYVATITITGYDLAWENELSTTLTVTITVTAPCTSRSITMSNFSKDFGSADFVPTHTVSAGSGTKTWTSSNTDVATIVAGKVHIVASGTTTIGLTVAEDDPYCEVSQSCTMTVNALVPTVTSFIGTSSSPTSITLTNAQVSNKGDAAISAYGYIYSTTASTAETLKLGETGVSTATVASADIAASTNFASKTVSGLTTGTTYYVRAYATNSAGTGYSAVQSVKTVGYTDYRFACGDLTLEAKLVTAETPIFITSAASQTVRSQDSIRIVGSGLTPSTALTFPGLNSKFSIKSRANGALSTKADGTIDTVAYIFYTPGAGDTSDGLDKLTGISVKVDGAKPRQVNLTQDIIGRHLPADFVIAAKYNNVWYALPDTMTGKRSPEPIEIAVDDNDNPSIAYTSNETLYQLYGQSSGAGYLEEAGWYVKLAMKNNKSENAPLSGDKSVSGVGKGGATVITNAIGEDYWWKFTQTSTSITNPQDAKYIAYCANNTTNHLRIKNKPNQWGLYSSGVEEIRLIPASTTPFTDAEVVAWGQKKLIVEVDKPTIGATQVRAKLNGSYSAKKSLATTTGTSVKGTSTRYNYTLDFTGEFDFSAESNKEKILLFEWLDGSDNVLYVSSVSVPLIIASSTNMSAVKTGAGGSGTKAYWKDLEVHILPGVILTANTGSLTTGTVINELHIYPGATFNIASATVAGSIEIGTLVLRNGWNRLTGDKSYDVARLYVQPYIDESHKASSLVATEAYMDWYIDYDQYYPIAVPWTVTVEDMSYVNTSGSAADGVIFRKYDGERRAADSKPGGGENTNWQTIKPTNLVPGIGYAMTARRPAGKAFSIVRMPLTIPSNDWTTNGEQGEVIVEAVTTHKDQVVVTAWADTKTPEYAKGWNFIANPYMSLYTGTIEYTDGTEVADLNIPDVEFKEFDQVATETKKLKPSSAFLIQAPKDGTIVFGTGKRASSAPSYRREVQDEPAPVQKAYIILSGDEAEDMMGLRIGAQYTEDYEINADLEKLLSNGNTLRTYMHYSDLNMAYVAINVTLAQEYIPVSVRIPADGEYTYSLHWASRIDELEGVYLYDYSTGQVTNLIEENYTFVAEAGTIHNRFAINAQKGQRDTPTDIDIGQAVGETDRSKPIKFLYRDKVYILFGSELYDATGKHVKTINR